ncbi:CsbD family protein [Amycolatopsis sp. NBC_01488]|uniref:CsbD family protein n=1 Tax=Amycolatopsis sp. NBC_01488 TaxID=2903563 RepID=UPI002E2E3A01|nr:CsbD family protein [Amycolatopsis sp. NBC_01488]
MTMKDKVRQTMGGAREKLGAATGNRRLEASGRMQRRRAQVAEVAHDLRSKARGLMRDAQVRRRPDRPADPW